jgi:hypothetical protein
MKAPKILANLSNVLSTVFLVVMIPCTIVGTYFIVVNSNEIHKNTEYRKKTEQVIDSLRIQLKLERRINTMHREVIIENIENYENKRPH